MKLRLRSRKTKETIKIEVSESCSVQELSEVICSYNLNNGETAFAFSLNGHDDIPVSSSQETLQSLGIASGDLVFFSPFSGSGARGIVAQEVILPTSDDGERRENESPEEKKARVTENIGSDDSADGVLMNLKDSDPRCSIEEVEHVSGSMRSTDLRVSEPMDANEKSFSEPYFLRKVLKDEVLGDECEKKLLIAAVHAVFLETSFVRYDPVSGTMIGGLHVGDDWPSKGSSLSIFYTLPALLGKDGDVDFVKLRIQTMSIFVNVYGSLGNGGLRTHRVCLDGKRFGPTLLSLSKDHDSSETEMINCEREVFECWKIIKDELAYPLLIELCDKTNSSLPPCLMLLPMELKLKVLESLPGVDLARVGCVCKELWYLSSNDSLWKQKFAEEFGVTVSSPFSSNWKKNFVRIWNIKKHRALPSNRPSPLLFPTGHPFPIPGFPIVRRDPDPLSVPLFLGGDYDRMPGLATPPLRYPGFRMLPYRLQ